MHLISVPAPASVSPNSCYFHLYQQTALSVAAKSPKIFSTSFFGRRLTQQSRSLNHRPSAPALAASVAIASATSKTGIQTRLPDGTPKGSNQPLPDFPPLVANGRKKTHGALSVVPFAAQTNLI